MSWYGPFQKNLRSFYDFFIVSLDKQQTRVIVSQTHTHRLIHNEKLITKDKACKGITLHSAKWIRKLICLGLAYPYYISCPLHEKYCKTFTNSSERRKCKDDISQHLDSLQILNPDKTLLSLTRSLANIIIHHMISHFIWSLKTSLTLYPW